MTAFGLMRPFISIFEAVRLSHTHTQTIQINSESLTTATHCRTLNSNKRLDLVTVHSVHKKHSHLCR